ncbi:MAG: tetratricopeptide repeat protein, partial [Spirochaetaceae bacterium]|nr:tetratricopeptide repeat protein [Spirochaetaceae bacterium]
MKLYVDIIKIMPTISILIIVVLIIGIAALGFSFISNTKNQGKSKAIKKNATKEEATREANKRLSKNPRDITALACLGNIAYEEENWAKSFEIYDILAEMPLATNELNQVQANIRAAVSAMQLGNNEAAYKYLVVARALDQGNFEVNYQLGVLEFRRGNYEKASQLLQYSLRINPEYIPAMRTLGYTLFKLKKAKDALYYIRKALEISPDDKESLFTLAECYSEAGQKDQALRIYSHLRPDDVWGPQACLASGLINVESHQDEMAVIDFEIGLKHHEIDEDTEIELNYQLADAYLRLQNIAGAMNNLQKIQSMRENYKNVTELVEKYREINANKNLQIFVMSSSGDFVTLCRKIVMT